jgi:hypothetical protein
MQSHVYDITPDALHARIYIPYVHAWYLTRLRCGYVHDLTKDFVSALRTHSNIHEISSSLRGELPSLLIAYYQGYAGCRSPPPVRYMGPAVLGSCSQNSQ